MQGQLPIWVEYIRALGTPFAALIFGIVAAWFSYRQWQLSEYRYRFDLFDRRYRIYASVQEIYSELLREDKISGENYSKFAATANEARFLFDDEIDAHIKKLVDAIFERQRLERKFGRKQLTDEEFEALSQQSDDAWDLIVSVMNELPEMFAKYLKLPK